MDEHLGPLQITRKSGDERFIGAPGIEANLLEFWQWSASDLVDNVHRGVLAEFIVAKALGVDVSTRQNWAAFDLRTPEGLTVEVKSSAYVQSWHQERHSTICFGVGETRGWDFLTNRWMKESKRQADVYVFALLNQRTKPQVNPLDLNQWEFYVVATAALNTAAGSRTSITLSSLRRLVAEPVAFSGLRQAVARALTSSPALPREHKSPRADV
jgi:hypothetical protein